MTTNQETHQACIHKCYPDLVIENVRLHNTEGQFNEILFINETFVFRFPRSAEVAETVALEVEILKRIRDYLSLPVPDLRYINLDQTACDHIFVGYPSLPGQPLWRETLSTIQDETLLNRLAEQLAGFLYELHHISPDTLGLRLPLQDGREDWVRLYQDFRTHLFAYMRPDAQADISRSFDDFLNDSAQYNYVPTLRHGDFGPSNILYDGASKTISGIIDFDSIGLGDPALDVGAILNLGEDFFHRMCRTYPGLADLQVRTKFYRSTYALQEALYGLRDNVPESFEAGIADYR